ncbi:MAG: C69 family dipeptidase [Acidobacteria bacterium]|nr:C69 family dipeptidase [Acidobacteriota bacterium]
MFSIKRLSYIILGIFIASAVFGCTSLLVTKGASADGSVIIVYTSDGPWLYNMTKTPAADHKPGEFVEFKDFRGNVLGTIPQVAHTYGVLGFSMNEHQVAIGETTFVGREELQNNKSPIKYWYLMRLALERAKTAREAITVMTTLAEQYGYGSEGESFSIGDKTEAWILEMIGSGNESKGAVWVAVRIPDGYISAHANMARIGEFPLDDPENCIYSKNIKSLAIEKGYWDPKSGKPFNFRDVYDPASVSKKRSCSGRVWSLFHRAAPSQNFSSDYCRGVEGTSDYPLYIKPDKKLSVKDVFTLMRDHYEGTPYDLTKGVDAGPWGDPNRPRPLDWEYEGAKYKWERPISIYNTSFSFVSQSRSELADEIGGLLWFGWDDTYTTCYVPLYPVMTEVPPTYKDGNMRKFSWDSAWWVFNFVANFARIKYSFMIKDIQKVQAELEDGFISTQKDIEAKALNMATRDERIKFLSDYSLTSATKTVKRWRELGESLIVKYNDGYIQNEKGRYEESGYPDEWKKQVIDIKGDQLRLPEEKEETKNP